MFYAKKPIVKVGPPNNTEPPPYFGAEYYDQSPGGLVYVAIYNANNQLEWAKSVLGTISAGRLDHATLSFAYNSSFPLKILASTDNIQVTGIKVIISEAFNGNTPVELSIGKDGAQEELVEKIKINPSDVATNLFSSDISYLAGQEIKLFKNVTVGTTQGAGTIILEFIKL